MKPDYKLVAKAKYIHMTADLASEVWHEVYKRYFPAKQLDALIENLQSADAIEEDIDNDVNYFLVFLGSSLIGYFAWKMENTSLHLLHLYLKPEYRGKAIGRDIVASCERLARGEGRGRVWCGVNAKALPVQQFFKARGYRSLGPAESEGGIERNVLADKYIDLVGMNTSNGAQAQIWNFVSGGNQEWNLERVDSTVQQTRAKAEEAHDPEPTPSQRKHQNDLVRKLNNAGKGRAGRKA